MNNMLSKAITISSYILLVVSAILFIGFNGEWVSTGSFIVWAYILLGIAAGAAVLFGLYNWIMTIISNPKKAMGSLIGIGGLLVVFGISYAISSDGGVSAAVIEKSGVDASTSRTVGMGIMAMYILGGLAVFSVIFSGVSKIFK